MGVTSIEWTDKTWNPTVGCTKVSAGCKHCYAETMHARLTSMGQSKYADLFTTVKPWPQHLAEPLTWKKPALVFVNSMSDIFHDDVPDEYIAAVFGVMAAAPQHTFQVLTKRAERMARWFNEWLPTWSNGFHIVGIDTAANNLLNEEQRKLQARGNDDGRNTDPRTWPQWPLKNVWMGVSVENQEQADARIPHLLRVPAAVRFLSCEPMLEPLDLGPWLDYRTHRKCVACHAVGPDGFRCSACGLSGWCGPALDWAIVGGESGHGARDFNLDWARAIVKQCRAAGVAVHVKQLGAKPYPGKIPRPEYGKGAWELEHIRITHKKGGNWDEWPADLRIREYPVVHT